MSLFAKLFQLLITPFTHKKTTANSASVESPASDNSIPLKDRCHQVLQNSWVENPGYTSPNLKQYPWQWLWDSCFHAIAWSALGIGRCVTELESLFSGMLATGFMPNTLYHTKPNADRWMWWVSGHSTITQPPMYGHTLRLLNERGFKVDHLLPQASLAMHHLIDSRLNRATGLVKVVHPWETGCDDSPRWARWMPFGYHRKLWNVTKYLLVRSMRVVEGEGVSNRLFAVCPASFNALVAFNAMELAMLTSDDELLRKAQSIAKSLEGTWQEEKRTWADVLPGGRISSDVPTLEAFLPLLVVADKHQVELAWAHLFNRDQFLRPVGFAGVAVTNPAYRSNGYWRGGCWPQLVYLLWIAAVLSSRPEEEVIRELALIWLSASGLSEYWDPETGEGLGAIPQSWATVLIELARS